MIEVTLVVLQMKIKRVGTDPVELHKRLLGNPWIGQAFHFAGDPFAEKETNFVDGADRHAPAIARNRKR